MKGTDHTNKIEGIKIAAEDSRPRERKEQESPALSGFTRNLNLSFFFRQWTAHVAHTLSNIVKT